MPNYQSTNNKIHLILVAMENYDAAHLNLDKIPRKEFWIQL